MKKFIIPIAATGSIALLAILYFVFFSSTSPFEVIPDSAVAVIEINDWSKFSTSLSSGQISAITNTEAEKKLQREVLLLNQLFSNKATAKAAFQTGITASLHLTSAQDYDYLFTVKGTGVSNDDLLSLFTTNIRVTGINKRIFKNRTVVDATLKDGGQFSCAIINGILCFSFTPFLTETSITTFSSGDNIYHIKELSKAKHKLKDIAGNTESYARLFVNMNKLNVMFPVVIEPAKANLLRDIYEGQNWCAFDISLQADRISLTGVMHNADKDYKGVDTRNIFASTIWNYLPDNAAIAQVNLNSLVDKSTEEKKNVPMANSDFSSWAGDAHAFVILEPLREEFAEQNCFMIQTKDDASALSSLKHLLSVDGSSSNAVDTFMNQLIFNLKSGGIINQLYGNSLVTFGNAYFCVANHVAIFCNNKDVLRFVLEKIKSGETLNKDIALKNAIGDTKSVESGLLYINPAKSSQLLSSLFKDGSTLQDYIAGLKGITVAKNETEDWAELRINLAAGTGGKASQGLLWKTKLQAYSDFAPQLVTNKANGNQEIFTQDTANNIYLLSASGEIIFTKNIDGKILGNVLQLDYYNNGSLQYILNTAKSVYVLDRTGNDVAAYPLHLASDATSGLTLVAGNKYYVPCANGAVYGFEANGRPLAGWSPRRGVGNVSKQMQVIGKLNLVFNDAGKLMLLNTKGETTWAVDNLPQTAQNFSVVRAGNEIKFLNASGSQLLEVSYDGNDKMKSLIDSAAGFAAVNISDTSYQYYYSSGHNVRCYDNNDVFKYAVSVSAAGSIGLKAAEINGAKYIIVKDEEMKRVYVYDIALSPVANYIVANTKAFTITDLFGRNELIGIQPDAQGNITCYRIK